MRRILTLFTAFAAAACAGGSSASPSAAPEPAAAPPISASLGIDLAEYTRTPQGLYYRDLKVGEGKVAAVNSRVVVGYRGALARTGAQIDSSAGFGISLSNDPIIRGWKLGIPGMKEGGVRNLVIPPELGYGSREVANVPPHSTLVFQIHLRQVR
jgi:FKBP-type peptidyl-prolyl cis-trans isomerase